MSITYHPDKNKAENATEIFRGVSKAYQVLGNNESKANFDYYLDHPREYYKVSGHYLMQAMPKSNVWLVVLGMLSLGSLLMYTIQKQKHDRVVRYLKEATMQNLPLNSGGNKQTAELFKRATILFSTRYKERAMNDNPKLKPSKVPELGQRKMMAEPLFSEIVDELVSQVKIEGGFRKPTWKDLLITRCLLLPYSVSVSLYEYYRFEIRGDEPNDEEKLKFTIKRVGMGTWDNISDAEKEKLLEKGIWKKDAFDAYMEEHISAEKRKQDAKLKALKKRYRRAGISDEDLSDYESD
jgi:hypothetical protein